MNTNHPNILFIFEIEDQNSSLLDTKIMMRNTETKTFETSVCVGKEHSVVILLIFRVLFPGHIKFDC